MSLHGLAHLAGVSRETFWRWRQADPGLERDVLSAIAEYEWTLCSAHLDAVYSDNPALMAQARASLAQRFPQRHGADPRMRLSPAAEREGYAEDLADASSNAVTDTGREKLIALVDRLMEGDNG